MLGATCVKKIDLKSGIKDNWKWVMKERLKGWIRKKVARNSFLANIFIFIHIILGRKPFSLGYDIYKFKKIKDIADSHLSYFREEKLPQGYGYALDERVVEYPWFLSRLKEEEKKILDAGATLNHKEILNLQCLKDRKVYILTLSYEHFNAVSPNTPSYIFEDLRDLSFKDDCFDTVVCISTLEHIGMDNTLFFTSDISKKENNKHAFLTAIKEFRRVLKKGGTLYLTVPYGRYKDNQWFQIFDAQMVSLIKKEFMSDQEFEFYFKYENRQWNYSNAAECKNAEFFDIHQEHQRRDDYLAASQSVACLELVK